MVNPRPGFFYSLFLVPKLRLGTPSPKLRFALINFLMTGTRSCISENENGEKRCQEPFYFIELLFLNVTFVFSNPWFVKQLRNFY